MPGIDQLIGAVADAIRDDTTLVSLMHANNETGVVFPIAEMAEIAKDAADRKDEAGS